MTIRSLLHAVVKICIVFWKVLMRKVLTRCTIVLWCRFRQNENWKLLRCDIFALLHLKVMLTSFVKRFSKKLCIKSSLFCDFSDWKHVRTLATCNKKTFSSRKFLKAMSCFFWKIRLQSNEFLSPIPYFCDKSKEYLDLNQSSNLKTCIFLGLIFVRN